jgi:predicted dinucleotide-binding enzyme
MEITIIGTGQMARGVATRALAGRHSVTLVGRTASKAEALANDLPERVTIAGVRDRLRGVMVVLAVPYCALEEVLCRYGPELDRRVLVDVTNPLRAITPVGAPAGSAAEEIAVRVPGARVVKAFNTTFAGPLRRGVVAEQPIDVLVASDHEQAKRTVIRLATDGGLRALDAGPLARARELEALGYLHKCLQERLGTACASTIRLLASPDPGSLVPDWVPPLPAAHTRRLSVLSRTG